MYRKMPARCNFISKGRIFIRKGFNKIRFGLFGTSLALPALIFNNCNGSCGNCYRCLASATPLFVMAAILLTRRIRNHKKAIPDPATNISFNPTKKV